MTAIAISEPQAGSDVTAINTRARKDGESYVLTAASNGAATASVADLSW